MRTLGYSFYACVHPALGLDLQVGRPHMSASNVYIMTLAEMVHVCPITMLMATFCLIRSSSPWLATMAAIGVSIAKRVYTLIILDQGDILPRVTSE